MFAAPAEGTLKDFMEFGDTGCADHEQSPPHQRTHAAEHYAKLINRNGRYGRFRHASSLPEPHTYRPEPDPPESALQVLESISNRGLCDLLLNFRLLFVLHSRIPANEGLPELVIEHLCSDLQ